MKVSCSHCDFIYSLDMLFFSINLCFVFVFSGPRSHPVPQRGERVKQRTVHLRSIAISDTAHVM
jgi:hypothetical protein